MLGPSSSPREYHSSDLLVATLLPLGSDQLAGEGETFERIEMGVNPAAQKAAQEAAEEKKRREAERLHLIL